MPVNKDKLLGRVNFPVYAVNVLSERHILVSGGGGSSKTGVANKLEVLEILPEDKGQCRAEVVASHETGDTAVMNCSLINYKDSKHIFLAAGKNEMCEIYRIKYALGNHGHANGTASRPAEQRAPKEGDHGNVRQRRAPPAAGQQAKDQGDLEAAKDRNHNLRIGFHIQPETSFQTDFNEKEEGFQKVCRFAPFKNILVTGGSDGHLRIWQCPEYRMIVDVKAHSDQIDDITISPMDESIVTISKDGTGSVWSFEGEKMTDLPLKLPQNDKFLFRSCRFGTVEGHAKTSRLFTLVNPVVRKKPPLPTYIIKWNPHKAFAAEKMQPAGIDPFSAMAISDDGVFIGVGRLSGTVEIYISFSLQRIYVAEKSHNIFVTGLAFLRNCNETRRLTANSDATLVSISVDNLIKSHHINPLPSMGITSLVVVFIIFMFCVYIFLDFLGL